MCAAPATNMCAAPATNMCAAPATNMFVACAESTSLPQPQCHEHRLALPEDFADFFEVLAADIRNPGKAGLMGAISAGVVDAQEFIRRPEEVLTIQSAAH